MKANTMKIKIAMAKNCITTVDLCQKVNMSRTTFNNVLSGKSVRPVSLGKIAKALGVDVCEIMEVKN